MQGITALCLKKWHRNHDCGSHTSSGGEVAQIHGPWPSVQAQCSSRLCSCWIVGLLEQWQAEDLPTCSMWSPPQRRHRPKLQKWMSPAQSPTKTTPNNNKDQNSGDYYKVRFFSVVSHSHSSFSHLIHWDKNNHRCPNHPKITERLFYDVLCSILKIFPLSRGSIYDTKPNFMH